MSERDATSLPSRPEPLTFVVRDIATGAVLDVFREDELSTYERASEKTWHEAALWVYVATRRHEEAAHG